MARPVIDMQAHVDLDDAVFLIFYDGNLSQTVHLTSEQAIEVGAIGRMAKARAEAREKQNGES